MQAAPTVFDYPSDEEGDLEGDTCLVCKRGPQGAPELLLCTYVFCESVQGNAEQLIGFCMPRLSHTQVSCSRGVPFCLCRNRCL